MDGTKLALGVLTVLPLVRLGAGGHVKGAAVELFPFPLWAARESVRGLGPEVSGTSYSVVPTVLFCGPSYQETRSRDDAHSLFPTPQSHGRPGACPTPGAYWTPGPGATRPPPRQANGLWRRSARRPGFEGPSFRVRTGHPTLT